MPGVASRHSFLEGFTHTIQITYVGIHVKARCDDDHAPLRIECVEAEVEVDRNVNVTYFYNNPLYTVVNGTEYIQQIANTIETQSIRHTRLDFF